MEAWRSGDKVATTLGANPGTNPGANKRESKLEAKLAANARSQDTAARVPRFARMTTTNLVQTVSEPREAEKYPGIVKFYWAAPTAADPERGSCGQQYENGPLRFLLRVLRRRVQPAANDVRSKMNHARDTSTSFRDDRRTRKCDNRPQKNNSRTLQKHEK